MSSKAILSVPDADHLYVYYGWWYNLYLNAGNKIPDVPRRRFQVKVATQRKIAERICDFDICLTGVGDFGGKGSEDSTLAEKQLDKYQLIGARLLLLAEFVRELATSSPEEFKALDEVGAITMIAVQLFEGEKCHNTVAKELRDCLARASNNPQMDNMMAKFRKPIKFKKKPTVTQGIINQYLKKKKG